MIGALRIFVGLWLVLALCAFGYQYVVELIHDIRRGSPDEPPEEL